MKNTIMSTQISSSTCGALSQKKLRGIYWKTFVVFVNKDDSYIRNDHPPLPERSQNQRRQGSFEYMELTAQGGSSAASDSTESCISSVNSSEESWKDERPPPYAVLDMSVRREIALDNDITIIEGCTESSEVRSLPSSPVPLVVTSPKFSPIGIQSSKNHRLYTHQQLDSDRLATRTESVDIDKLQVERDDESEENSFDRLESTSPSMEPAPWKDHDVSIQLWMVPNFLSKNDDKLVSMPPFPEFDHCHYVPTLEAILEESEESPDGRNLSRSRLTKSASFSDDNELNTLVNEIKQKRSNSLGDVVDVFPLCQDDLYSITSTFGSFNSMRRITTLENLNADEKDDTLLAESDGSSDELDRTACYRGTPDSEGHSKGESVRDGASPERADSDISKMSDCDKTESMKSESVSKTSEGTSEKNASEGEIQTNEISDRQASESSRDALPESAAPSIVSTDFQSSGRSSPMVESAPELYDFYSDFCSTKSPSIRRDSGFTISDYDFPTGRRNSDMCSNPSSIQRDSGVTISDVDVPGLPKELYFDSKDIPKIVVMFAQQELERDRMTEVEGEIQTPGCATGLYRRRSGHDMEESTRGGAVQRRVSKIKLADTSRLSTLSSSTPELSATNDECLLYIPVSYATEAAARKKKKRNATLTTAEALRRKTNLSKALHTRSLISGSGLGNGFSSLRKRLRSRKAVSGTLRRSQSEKPQLSYSSPDVSSPMARFLNSPRRRANLKTDGGDVSNDNRKGKSIKKTFSNVLRRLSSRFSSQRRRPVVVKKDYKVIEESSPVMSSLDENGEDTASESYSTRSKDSPSYSPYKYVRPADPLIALFRDRSQSVPMRYQMRSRSQSSSLRNGSTESDVFESIPSEDSLDKTVYL